MADISLMMDLLSHYKEISSNCANLMEKWQREVQEYKEFDNLATEYFGE